LQKKYATGVGLKLTVLSTKNVTVYTWLGFGKRRHSFKLDLECPNMYRNFAKLEFFLLKWTRLFNYGLIKRYYTLPSF